MGEAPAEGELGPGTQVVRGVFVLPNSPVCAILFKTHLVVRFDPSS